MDNQPATYIVTHKERPTEERRVSEPQLARTLLEICGGGYTEHQTMTAMNMEYKLHQGESVKFGKWTVTPACK